MAGACGAARAQRGNGVVGSGAPLLARAAAASAPTQQLGIHDASEVGDTERVRALLLRGTDVLSRDKYADTPLHKATVRGHSETAKLLLVSGADAGAANAYGWTPLHYACAAGAVDSARLLLVWGAACGAQDAQGDSPLHLACYHGHGDAVALLLAWGAEVGVQRQGGVQPLHWACQQGHTAVAEALLERGACVEAPDGCGDRPLHCAARFDRTRTLRALLAAGAQLTARAAQGDTALHCAAEAGAVGCLAALLEEEEQREDRLAGEGASASPSARLAPDERSDSGATPLHRAAGAGQVAAARTLLAAGADLHSADDQGCTPLHAAACCPSEATQAAVTRLLLAAGAPAHSPNARGWGALHVATDCGSLDCAHALLQAGAPASQPEQLGWTPLHIAAAMGHLQVAQLLVTRGAHLEARALDGNTPLGFAATDAMRELLMGGALAAEGEQRDGDNRGVTLADVLARHSAAASAVPHPHAPPRPLAPSADAMAPVTGVTPGGEKPHIVSAAVPPPEAAPQADNFVALSMLLAGRVFRALGVGHPRETYAQALLVELKHAHLPYEAPAFFQVVYRGALVANHQADVVVEGIDGGLLLLTAAPGGVPMDALAQMEACLTAAPAVPAGGVLNFNPNGGLDVEFRRRGQ